MKKLLWLITICFFALEARCEVHKVVDSVSGMPLPKASVFSHEGRLIGLSDTDGNTPFIPNGDYPIKISYTGYGPQTVPYGEDKTVRLKEIELELPEVVISSARQQVIRLKGYIREYSTLLDEYNVMLFREKMVDFVFPLKDTKNFDGWQRPRLLGVKSYYHFTNALGLDSVSNFYPSHFSWSDWIGVPDGFMLPKSLRHVESGIVLTDTVKGRWGDASIWRRQGTRLYVDVNVLADTISRRWIPKFRKSFYDDVDFTDFDVQYCYDDISGDRIYPWDISRITYNIESNGINRFYDKGPVYKASRYMDTYAELYIYDREIMTVKEARKLMNELPSPDNFFIPPDVPELQPSILAIVDRVNNIDHNAVRLGLAMDERLGKGDFDPESHTLLGKIRTLFGYKKSKYQKKVRNESEETKAFRKRFGIGDIDN